MHRKEDQIVIKEAKKSRRSCFIILQAFLSKTLITNVVVFVAAAVAALSRSMKNVGIVFSNSSSNSSKALFGQKMNKKKKNCGTTTTTTTATTTTKSDIFHTKIQEHARPDVPTTISGPKGSG